MRWWSTPSGKRRIIRTVDSRFCRATVIKSKTRSRSTEHLCWCGVGSITHSYARDSDMLWTNVWWRWGRIRDLTSTEKYKPYKPQVKYDSHNYQCYYYSHDNRARECHFCTYWNDINIHLKQQLAIYIQYIQHLLLHTIILHLSSSSSWLVLNRLLVN